ncbi:acylphosphatase [Kyrpidia spormannii]|uniref:Acylphosphatase n=2 Tax=Kyrpidia spormannii TaxID=2055160 RepID=A0ACA8ZA25_9BACL|nr:acylphosphatase [Kyrpidia spormannii]CAB3393163.1 Acylphosphatase [Kyrpidia spormannii]CAB3394082.1 Acylphosphatase [Kyrpidia spormannii]
MIHQHLVVHGKVQGVGFRAYTARQAANLNIRGWVRNHPEGTVEINAAGSAEAMEAFVRAVKKGPPGSRVDLVEITSLDVPLTDQTFTIRR